MSIRLTFFAAALAALSLAIFPGCGNSSGLDKVIVHGKVTYDGKPIELGDIYFDPTQGTKGSVSGSTIIDGEFRVKGKGGVPVGKHIVRIEGYNVPESGGGGDMISDGGKGLREPYVPAKHNSQSELIIEVTGDSSKMEKDFELEK